jgi:O-antigen/teichoic acid export membrane protein
MSLKRNTIANYIGQFYLIGIGIVILPFYLHYLGAAAFGLIGLFATLQACLKILDMGLTPTLSRQVAYARGKNTNFLELLQLLRSLELIFLLVSMLIALIIVLSSNWIAHNWLKVDGLSYHTVTVCIALMGVMFGLRWFSDLYNSGIQGLEEQVWLNMINIIIATLQYGGGLIIIKWLTDNPIVFFEYQVGVSIFSLLIVMVKFYQFFPSDCKVGFHISWQEIKKIFPFSGGVAYTATIWLVVTQFGKLLLSNILPLSEYGYFSLVTTLANGVMQLAAPIGQAILPRMTRLLAQGDERQMLYLYRGATQVMCVIMFSTVAIVAAFPQQLLFAWTGNQVVAEWGAPILFWYILGNGILSVLAFQYYLQFAHGKLKLHVVLNTIAVFMLVPAIFFAAYHYGAYGTAIVWFSIQAVSFIIFPPIVHRFFAPGIHLSWVFKDICPVFFATAVLFIGAKQIAIPFGQFTRLEGFMVLLVLGALMLIINAAASSRCRYVFFKMFR